LHPHQAVLLVVGEVEFGGFVGGLGGEARRRIEALDDGVALNVVLVVDVVVVRQAVVADIGRA